jgi:hypothetical protein
MALALVAAWLVAAGPLGSGLPAVGAAVSAPAADVSSPSMTPCHNLLSFFCTPTPSSTSGTSSPTATPTPTPTPPPTAAPTAPPTPYAEKIDTQQSEQTIPPSTSSLAVTPHPTGGGSPLPEWALLGMVVCAVIAGTSFFLFFRIR